MLNGSIVREAIIASVTAFTSIPLLWGLTAAINPERDARSPGLDFALITIVTAGLVMLLRSIWRDTGANIADPHRRFDGRERCEYEERYGNGNS